MFRWVRDATPYSQSPWLGHGSREHPPMRLSHFNQMAFSMSIYHTGASPCFSDFLSAAHENSVHLLLFDVPFQCAVSFLLESQQGSHWSLAVMTRPGRIPVQPGLQGIAETGSRGKPSPSLHAFLLRTPAYQACVLVSLLWHHWPLRYKQFYPCYPHPPHLNHRIRRNIRQGQ